MILTLFFLAVTSQYKFETITENKKIERLHIHEEKEIFKNILYEAVDLQIYNSN